MGEGSAAPLRTHTFAADRLRFVVESPDAETVGFMEKLFADLVAPADDHDASEVVSFHVAPDGSSGWRVRGPRIGRQTAPDLRSAVMQLLAGVNVTALDVSPDRLHLHAAAAVRDGRAVVMAAKRNTGKTTTVAHLATRPGWSFITDETVSLSPDDELVRGTPRPLSVKPHGRPLLEFLAAHMLPQPVLDGERQFVPLGAAGADVVAGAPPQLIVLLRRPAWSNSASSASVLHPADAVVALMEETLDAQRFGPGAVHLLARVASSARCLELVVGDLPATLEIIESFMDEDVPADSRIEARHPAGCVDPAVRSVTIDGRAVAHHTETGVIVAFDEDGTRIWDALHRDDSQLASDLNDPEVDAFVDQLRVHEMVRPGTRR